MHRSRRNSPVHSLHVTAIVLLAIPRAGRGWMISPIHNIENHGKHHSRRSTLAQLFYSNDASDAPILKATVDGNRMAASCSPSPPPYFVKDDMPLRETSSSSPSDSSPTSSVSATHSDPAVRPFRVNEKAPSRVPHLFRFYDDISFDSWLRCAEPGPFWHSIGYVDSTTAATATVTATTPTIPEDLKTAPVHAQLAPHARFLVEVWKGGNGTFHWLDDHSMMAIPDSSNPQGDHERENVVTYTAIHNVRISEETRQDLPISFFRLSIERQVAPWHAYLQHTGLPSGPALLRDREKIQAFCQVCESNSLSQFSQLCTTWSNDMDPQQPQQQQQHPVARIIAFCRAFRRGLLPAIRNAESGDWETAQCTPSQMVRLLVSHGANFLQKDKYGVSMLHWAAGTDHLMAVQVLVEAIVKERYPEVPEWIHPDDIIGAVLLESTDAKDGATPLHWAACGFANQAIGIGGSREICHWMIEQAGSLREDLVNAGTWKKSTPLMWAAWAGSIDVAELLIDAGCKIDHYNNRKQNAAHWAAAAGQLAMCQLLWDKMGSDYFHQSDNDGKTPYDYAQQYNRAKVIQWLQTVCVR